MAPQLLRVGGWFLEPHTQQGNWGNIWKCFERPWDFYTIFFIAVPLLPHTHGSHRHQPSSGTIFPWLAPHLAKDKAQHSPDGAHSVADLKWGGC